MTTKLQKPFVFEPLESRQLLSTAPFSVGGSPFVHAQDFRITTFATGLNFPNGMTKLSDGSLLVATNIPGAGGYFGASTGELVRLVDANGDGVADGPGRVLATGLPRLITDVRVAGNMVFVTSAGANGQGIQPSIHIFTLGRKVTSPLTPLSTLTFNFPLDWQHVTYALETRPTPGKPGSYDIFFNVGSQDDHDTTPPSMTIGLTSSDGYLAGQMHPDSIYMLTVTPRKGGATFTNLRQVAYGLRNAAGISIQPYSGDLYFEDNGINGGLSGNDNPQLSADEINIIPFAQIGNGNPPDFGFAHDYIVQATGERVGSGAVQPIAAFQPVNGSIAEGPQDIAHAPLGFPAPLNHGVFLGFYGQGNYTGNGLVNTQNPVIYFDRYSGQYFDFISNDEPAIGHPVGWLSTADSLFFSDLSPDNTFTNGGGGVIYQIQAKPRTYTISGNVFADNNGNAHRDAQEGGLAGQTVYIDYNGNGILDAADVSTVTDAKGNYSFNVPLGDYRISVVLAAGFHQLTPAYLFTAFRGKASAGMNFGLVPIT